MSAPERPLLRYLGSKHRLAPKIVQWLPPHSLYVEPFGGSAAILGHKPRSQREIYNDLDGEVVNLFRVLRSDRAGDLVRAVQLTPYAREEHALSYEPVNDPVERARRLLVRSHMGHGNNGTLITNKNGFRIDGTTGNTDVARNWLGFPAQIEAWIERLSGVMIENRPALELVERYAVPETLFYLDPPYVPETRSKSVRWSTGKCSYAHEMSIDDHAALLDAIVASPAMVVLSGYRSELYDAALRDWRRLELKARAHGNLPRTEVVWINRAAAAAHGLFAA